MLTSGFRILWVKVQLNGARHFYLNLPISLYVFEELLDCIMDLLDLACFFTPKKQVSNSSSVSVHTVRALTYALIKLLDSLVGPDPYNLVDVEVENVKVSVKIR